MPEPPEVPDAPPKRDPDLKPATVGELRSVRRWLLVTAVWAIAATAVALIALLSQDDTAEKESRNVGERVTRLERDLDSRLESIEEDVSSLAQREDVTKLAQRLSRVEDSSSKAASGAKDVKSQVDDLETRIEDLEESADAGADRDTGNNDGAGGSP